ncbi:MAG TPA: hypothetical protein VIN07_12195 [Flavipsychrobacter sp.]
MRYAIALMTVALLWTGCRPDIEMYPTATFDTLGVQWMVIERNNMTYYYQGTGVKAASIYSDLHEEAYDRLEAVFNPVLPYKLRYFVWTDWKQAQQLFGTPEWVAGLAFSRSCMCHVRADINLGHEMTHVLAYWAEGVEPNSYSRFINEGVAVAFDQRDHDKMEEAKNTVSQYSLNSITELWADSLETAPHELIYPVGGAFMEYMYSNTTRSEYIALLKNQALPDAEKVFGKERLDRFIADFDSQLGL